MVSSFADLVREAERRFRENGYEGVLELHLSRDQAVSAGRELQTAIRVIDAALSPPEVPARGAERLFALVEGVLVYVRED